MNGTITMTDTWHLSKSHQTSFMAWLHPFDLTHWGQVMHICVSKLTIIGSDIGLSPGRHQAIIRTNIDILLIGPLWINFSELSVRIHIFSSKKTHLKVSSGKCQPFCLDLDVLRYGPGDLVLQQSSISADDKTVLGIHMWKRQLSNKHTKLYSIRLGKLLYRTLIPCFLSLFHVCQFDTNVYYTPDNKDTWINIQ